MLEPLKNPLYYLDNFQKVVDWVSAHHRDLLTLEECTFLEGFSKLSLASRALLVRMVMRKGALFRAQKLRYAEIGCPLHAAASLVEQGWVDDDPMLDSEQLAGLLTRHELLQYLGSHLARSGDSKGQMLQALRAADLAPATFSTWCPGSGDRVLRLTIDAFCARLRLMFFGNARQDWSEFVLADLGIYRYEKVAFVPGARVFRSRQDVDDYLHLQACRDRLHAGEALDSVLADVPAQAYANEWVEARRRKLRFRLAMQYEREAELASALRLHLGNPYPAARCRAVRVLERLGDTRAAYELACQLRDVPQDESEAQQVQRILPRLCRRLGVSPAPASPLATPRRIDLVLPAPEEGVTVELAVRDYLSRPDSPVHYVENGLLNALFCLLCWDAIYAPVPGAFFHPFHAAPADLHQPGFQARRAELFAASLGHLDTQAYRDWILRTYVQKQGIQSPFLAWGLLDEMLIRRALSCIPAAHLKAIFARILADMSGNRAGLPDLIQFWPDQGRYRMIEVKGPGDRLQDNQRRWIDYFSRHDIPVEVAYVQWSPTP